MNQIHTT